jgi:hypothetical protein
VWIYSFAALEAGEEERLAYRVRGVHRDTDIISEAESVCPARNFQSVLDTQSSALAAAPGVWRVYRRGWMKGLGEPGKDLFFLSTSAVHGRGAPCIGMISLYLWGMVGDALFVRGIQTKAMG